jgi:hypothetical protein
VFCSFLWGLSFPTTGTILFTPHVSLVFHDTYRSPFGNQAAAMEQKIPGVSCDGEDNTDDENSGKDDDDANGDDDEDEYWSKFCFKT